MKKWRNGVKEDLGATKIKSCKDIRINEYSSYSPFCPSFKTLIESIYLSK